MKQGEQTKSLLEEVKKAEYEIRSQILKTRKDTDKSIEAANQGASNILEKAKVEGKKNADSFYKSEIQKVKKEAEKLKADGLKEAEKTRKKGSENKKKAVDKILKKVLGE